jgi:endothelin-converting enzyme/putative endopeptidase
MMTRTLLRFTALVSALSLLATSPLQQSLTSYLAPANRDLTCPACRDFWRYANGGWLAANPIPPDRVRWGIEHDLDDANRNLIRAALEKTQTTRPPIGSPEQLAGDYYAACMNESAIEAAGAAPLRAELARIDAVADLDGVLAETARFSALGIGNAFFGLGNEADPHDSRQTIADLGQSGLSLPEREYYFRTDDATKNVRAKFLEHARNLLVLAGESETDAAADADTVLRVETALAKPQFPIEKLRDPQLLTNPYRVSGLSALGPAIDWRRYFAAHGIRSDVAVNVDEPSYFKALETQLAAAPVADLKTYLRFHYVNANAGALSKQFVDEQFAFSSMLNGAKKQLPRWRRCLNQTYGPLGDLIGQIFVKRAFSPADRARANVMVHNLRAALAEDIPHLGWMGPRTKARAQRKLAMMVQKIGYPDAWRTFPGLRVVRDDFFADRANANRINVERELHKIGKPTNRAEWGLEPQTINAQYDPTFNDITFPAAILLPPFYRAGDDDAMNYGAIGAVIGHEITHGFDDQGRQFDELGNLKDWWTPQDARHFQTRAQCIIDQFDHTVAVGTVRYKGKQDSGEAIADLGGIKIAYDAFERAQAGKPRTIIAGYTPEQRFFIAFAMDWAANQREASMRLQAQTDVHPINRDRVLVTLQNFPPFARAFHCKQGDGMVKPAAKVCSVW